MKQIIIITIMLLVLLATACHKDEDEFFTNVGVTVALTEAGTIEQVQGNATFTNLNNGLTFSSSDWNGATLSSSIERGSYSVLIEGYVKYRNAQGVSQIRQFRAYTDYVSFMDVPSATQLDIIFL